MQFSNYYFTVSTQQYELENELRIRNIDIADCVAEIEPTCVSALNKLSNFVFCAYCCVTQVAHAYCCAFLRFCVLVAEINVTVFCSLSTVRQQYESRLLWVLFDLRLIYLHCLGSMLVSFFSTRHFDYVITSHLTSHLTERHRCTRTVPWMLSSKS